MSNDRFKCRAWLEVPIDTSEGTTICGFYVYDVVVLPERNHIFPKGGYVGFPLETLKESLGRYRELENDIMERLDGNGNCEISEYLYAEPKSIEQCIGLKDKNDRLIYEGDIVKELIFGTELAVIEFGEKDGYLCFYPNWKTKVSTGWRKDLKWMCEKGLEVIGNIHENKSLLEGIK